MKPVKTSDPATRITELTAKRDELVKRLDTGATRIEEARAKGRNVYDWEDYWIQLLRVYERVCEELNELTLGGYLGGGDAA